MRNLPSAVNNPSGSRQSWREPADSTTNMPRPKKNTSKSLYAIYLRCSTDDQKQGDFTTIDTQREINQEHVKSLGGTVVKEYADEGKTGTNINRPAFQQLLADAARGEFDTVCVTYMSRLGRGDAFIIAEYKLKELKVSVEMVKEKFADDLAGYMGKTMTTMMDGVYPKMVAQWTKTKMEKMVERGYHCGGTTPFGYKTEVVTDAAGFHSAEKAPPKRLVIDPEKAPLVRQAFDMAVGLSGLNEISRYLTAASGRRWYSTIVKHLLTSETYKGVQVFGDWRNESAHEPIVDALKWDAVQKVLEERNVRMFSRDRSDYVYLFRGLVWCPHCNCQYTTRSAHGRNGVVHYYSCQNADKNGDCPVQRVNADKLHEAVFAQLRRAIAHPTVMQKMYADYAHHWKDMAPPKELEERGVLAKRRQFVQVQIDNYTRAIGEGKALSSLLSALERAEADKSEIQKRLNEIDTHIAASKCTKPTIAEMTEAWKIFIEEWDELPDSLKDKAAQLFIRKIVITEKQRADVEIESIPTSASSLVRLTASSGSGGWT